MNQYTAYEEEFARIIDPDSWEFLDAMLSSSPPGTAEGIRKGDQMVLDSLEKARRIITRMDFMSTRALRNLLDGADLALAIAPDGPVGDFLRAIKREASQGLGIE